MMAAQDPSGRCVGQVNVSFPGSAANKNDTEQTGDAADDGREIVEGQVDVSLLRGSYARSVLVAQVPRDNVPEGNVLAVNTCVSELCTEVPSGEIRIIEGDFSGFESLRAWGFEEEEELGVLVAISRIKARNLFFQVLLSANAINESQ
jgi:hypothetical protein